jgi:hypothetical protein
MAAIDTYKSSKACGRRVRGNLDRSLCNSHLNRIRYQRITMLSSSLLLTHRLSGMSSESSQDLHHSIECYTRPGLLWSVEKQHEFIAELRKVAMQSFDFTDESELPTTSSWFIWITGLLNSMTLDSRQGSKYKTARPWSHELEFRVISRTYDRVG